MRLSPSLFAGEIRTENHVNRFAYSFLTKQSPRLEVSDRKAGAGNGLDFAANNARFKSDLSEYWVGGTWARPLRSNLGIGVTQFIAVRDQDVLFDDVSQALGQDPSEANLAVLSRDFKYRHWRLLWKIGVATRIRSSELGITVTTPGVGIGGSERLDAYGAFHTDYSGAEDDGRSRASAVPMNLYHFSGGAIVTTRRSSFTVGAVAALGSLPIHDVGEPGDFDTGREVRYLRLNFIVGFNFAFN